MIRSMTGFGRAEAVLNGKKIAVEMKSLNHRYLEVALRVPAMISPLEIDIRKKIGEQFSRGRIEVTLRVDDGETVDGECPMVLNLPRVRHYHALFTQLKKELNLPDEVTLSLMAGMRDIFMPKDADAASAVPWADVQTVLLDAMATLTEMRIKEGQTLKKDLIARIKTVKDYLAGVSRKAVAVVLDYRRRLTERIKELTNGMVIDEARLSQEVAIMAEKSDITEEIVRLESHMAQFVDLLECGDGIGRKLDFLIQEMSREVNTIGSKSGDADIARHVIEIKSELSKLREQVQNIE
ncbi:MAG: YicC family protein [Syntrophales bacterium]|nr:YicC family protein [Syntrophales bacterium]